MDKMTVRDIDIANKKVLLRVVFNVPIDENTGNIMDDNRIRAVIPTIRYLLEHRARVIICSHLGRPQGNIVEKLRLAHVAKRLFQILGEPVTYIPHCVGLMVEQTANKLRDGVKRATELHSYFDEQVNALKLIDEAKKLIKVT